MSFLSSQLLVRDRKCLARMVGELMLKLLCASIDICWGVQFCFVLRFGLYPCVVLVACTRLLSLSEFAKHPRMEAPSHKARLG